MRENIEKLIDFTLEVTNGCQYNCSGCSVDKEGNSWPSDSDFGRIEYLVDDLAKNDFKPMNLAIGPTDIMTSVNRDQILGSDMVKNLAKKFLKTSINCAFLDPFDENYISMGKKLNWLLEGGIVKFVIPFEAFHIDNKEYINRIRRRRDLVLSQMPNVKHHKTYLVINYETSSIYDKENNTNITEDLILKVYESELIGDFNTDIVLPQTRANLREPEVSSAFLKATHKLKTTMAAARKKYGYTVEIAETMTHEGKDWDIFYKAGKLYMTPFLLEGLACFDEKFEVTSDWTFDGLYSYYVDGLVSQIDWALNNEDCSSCQFVGMCAERGIHTLMQVVGTNKCISPAKNVENMVIWN